MEEGLQSLSTTDGCVTLELSCLPFTSLRSTRAEEHGSSKERLFAAFAGLHQDVADRKRYLDTRLGTRAKGNFHRVGTS